MKYIEKAGLIKFDFGTEDPDRHPLLLRPGTQKGIDLDISTIPLDDPKTFALLEATNVLGVFQIESTGMRDVIKKMKPNRIEDLGALVALYRPGPMDNIPTYIARKHGEEEIVYPHPMLKPILEKTYGVMVYQEQVMQIAQVMAGYSSVERIFCAGPWGKRTSSKWRTNAKFSSLGRSKTASTKRRRSTPLISWRNLPPTGSTNLTRTPMRWCHTGRRI